MGTVLCAIALSLAAAHLDPSAMSLLARMSATLGHAKSIVVTAHIEREARDDAGQMLDFYSTTQVALQRPNRLYAATAGDVQAYATWYDGAVLTVYKPQNKTYGRVIFTANDDAVLKRLSGRFTMSSPLVPFLASNPYERLSREIQTARVIGDVQAGEVLCRQLAFTGRDIDWQLWITIDDDTALPARMAAIFKHRPGKPRVVIQFDRWDLDLDLAPSTFRFAPPMGANAATFAM